MNENRWTEEKVAKLKELAETNISYSEIGKLINKTDSACRTKAHKIGISNYYKPKKYSHDDDFFAIPNPLNSYWAGYLAADGYIAYPKHHHGALLVLTLHEKDKLQVEILKAQMKFTGNIRDENMKRKSGLISYCKSIRISGAQKCLVDLKNNFNIEPKKTYRLAPPNLNDYLSFCYLAGYTDGDGSVQIRNTKNNEVSITWISASIKILEWIKSFLYDKFLTIRGPNNSKIYSIKGSRAYGYAVCGPMAMAIVEVINTIPNLPTLDRKWKNPRILEQLFIFKQRYPHLFTYKIEPPIEPQNAPIYIPEPEALTIQEPLETPESIIDKSLITA